jgi:ADP-ribose pyrophosphatase YjhB (NUDIX family)
MREASVMLIVKDGLILSISRRDDKTKFGLPGGKLEIGESPTQAAVRETFEETGVSVKVCSEIFRREEQAPGEVFYTYCFYAIAWGGEPKDSEEGAVKWLTTEELTVTHGAFPDYNRATLNAFKLKYPHIILK